MKNKASLCSLLLILLAAFSFTPTIVTGQTTLAAWDFTGKGGESSVDASVFSGVSAVAAVGGGLTPVGDLNNGLVGRNQTKTTLAEAIAADQYISFTLTPEEEQSITITAVKIRPVSQNETRSFALFSSLKPFALGNQLTEFTSSGIHQPLHVIKTEKSYTISLKGITVVGSKSSMAALTAPLEFRLYIYGHTDEWESVGIGERLPGLDEKDLIVLGSVSGPDLQAPSAPTNLASSSISSTGFKLSWTASTDNVGVVAYEVFADGIPKGKTANTFMQLSGLTPATTYAMTVKASDAASNVSEASAPLNVTTSEPGTHPNSNSRMGINLSGLRDYSDEQPFKDLFKSARPWLVDAIPNQLHPAQLSYDANGWITSLNGAANARAYLMISDNPAEVYEMGQYVLLYEGQGTIAFEGPGVSFVSETPGRIVYNVTSQPGNRSINITATTANNYLRNIRLLPLEYETNYQDNPWRPYILERWNKFKTLRFMDWMLTNHSTQVNWSDRTTPTWYTYNTYGNDQNGTEIPTKSGIPLELIVDLCNRLHADAWINVPHMASNTYVTNMATLLRDNLNPDLKIYIEYSNECWNYIFEQTWYCLENGKATYPELVGVDEFRAQLQWYSLRSVEIFNIFETVFGGTARLVRTLGAQQGNPGTPEVILEHGDAMNKADAVAIAPYFGHEYACDKYQQVKSSTLAQFFNDIKTVSLPLSWVNTEACINYIKSKGKLVVAYEGGQHFTGGVCEDNTNTFDDIALNQKFLDANLNSEMAEVYTLDLNKWKDLGGDMYCAFSATGNYSKYGYWGILLSPKQNPLDAPKYQAITQWIDDNPQ
ncbi:fibronectin type III domain-containing protein [Candidatus Electronema sp. PJ]|uniref:fibronectin type III domain-containing protein n=1 Tax=Candidatus Electronema sp. PJ TaxID=3401572 RepID=UPI003AA81C09